MAIREFVKALATSPQKAEFDEMLRKSGSSDLVVAVAAQNWIAKALTMPLRQGIESGDITFGIFEVTNFAPGAAVEYPLSWYAPGTERDFISYTLPNQGYIPQRSFEGDYVQVPTFRIGNAMDWTLKYARDARWDVVGRALEVYEAGFVKKINDDAWHVILATAYDRNIMVFDADAAQGQFTKRLVALAQTIMRRNGGGNSTSVNRGKLTDIFTSPESKEDVRSWGIDQVDDFTRRDIYLSGEGVLSNLFGTRVTDLDEFGVGQEYNNYFLNDLGGALGTSDVELAIGLDLSKNDSFMMPMREGLTTTEDPVLHRSGKAGFYGSMELGFAALDSRRALGLSL